MLSDAESRLLSAPSKDFPLIAAVAASMSRCRTCSGQGSLQVHVMLRTAINKYKSDKHFIEHCRGLFKLPCVVSGVLIDD